MSQFIDGAPRSPMCRLVALTVGLIATLGGDPSPVAAQPVRIDIDTPLSPPEWALLQRELIDANTAACEEFFAKYFDERGWLLCVERWGGDDGPDDAIENCNDWPILHALGADDVVRRMYERAWEGNLRQYTLAKTKETPLARDGMYYQEFITQFDWQHNAEGLGVFMQQGLSDPANADLHRRSRRFAGLYMNEDPQAPNYDPEHKVIRSLFNGSRGPLLRESTALDWTGDPIEVEHRFDLVHGERSYSEMLAHFEEYRDIIGDHPLNLLATCLPLNAYMIDHEEQYRTWLLEYVDAWRDRMEANGNIIPSKIGLDGKIGGPDGKWYGGVYGWAFTVKVPQTGEPAHRNRQERSFVGFMNAYLLTGDDKYLDVWRKQQDAINAQAKVINEEFSTPTMYGDDGWYGWTPGRYTANSLELYYLSMRPADRERTPDTPWLDSLEGRDPEYPVNALRKDLESVRAKVAGLRADETTPDTRLADDPMKYNPCQVESLIHLMLGGIHVERKASVLHCRLRYFDPVERRPGMPQGVAALVDRLTADSARVTLVNTNQLAARTVVVQAGGYGEHRFTSVKAGEQTTAVNGDCFEVRLAPGAGQTLELVMERYVNPPTMRLPWDR
jgi:hypothetical protein